ncbi:MAG: thiamine pyrophosphate-binding protein [SAR202 cluster bacterium]|jgi:benzoylformate decarboxylase|nr:MAG: thiamine pyrophosphate-binding protein [SAR202 cluster bacterium]KAA1301486.1 MAG: thiamine pyrophosphate-binding protein [SAR202 cluster bacterium]MCH2530883.1 thiamine pyrophosphate-binding protein [Dehalococcoidia bacterium]MQG89305.1 thiamine pyrophosphate-binding protein [SAR202 cluster bacterium]GIT18056.1 MAG: benzoylformate decarboxylase [Dehalococcoidia bacterium]
MKLEGKHALLQMFVAEGVNYVFGNPGTSETPMMTILPEYKDLDYILVLQEGVAVGMAEGYGRSTGTVPLVSLHIDNGMANGLSLMIDQLRSGTPMVMTAGNKDIRKLGPGRSDLAELARPFAKWSAEITHAGQVPSVIRRAFQEAKTSPTGPVFVGMSANAFDDVADVNIQPSTDVVQNSSTDPNTLEEVCDLLSTASKPIMIIGDRLNGANQAAVKLAETAGIPVYGHGSFEVNFPATHPLWQGNLSVRNPDAVKAIRSADLIIAAGCTVFDDFFYQAEDIIPKSAKLVHIDSDPSSVGKSEPSDIAILAAPSEVITQLAESVSYEFTGTKAEEAALRVKDAASVSSARREAFAKSAMKQRNMSPMSPSTFAATFADALPSDATVFNDGISTGGLIFEAMSPDERGSYYAIRGGAIGWGMGATMGVQLGQPDRPVVGVMGDGTAIMTIQALWTAANSNIPAVFVICNNRSYRILKLNSNVYHRMQGLQTPESYVASDFDLPLDFKSQADAYGVEGVRVETPDELTAQIQRGCELNKPLVIDAVIDGTV